LDLTKLKLGTRDIVFEKINFLSSSRETCFTFQTNFDPNLNATLHNQSNYFNSNRNEEHSPMKIIDRLTGSDLNTKEEIDLKALYLKLKREQIKRNNLKLENFVKEIDLKDEKSKTLLNNENQATKPCCNELDCNIF